MQDRYPGALGLSRRVLGWLRILNVVYGTGIVLLLLASVVVPEFLFAALRVPRGPAWGAAALGMRGIMIIGIAGAFIAHRILTLLLRIVDTVRAGDPFVLDNAARLQAIACWVLGAELLHLVVGAIASWMSTPEQPFDLDLSYSFTPWITVLLLFVLARVFAHGARMRDDIEGTV
jgi:hypothetical protein